jgi:demethylmenaquinone methyltransferase / 2-methoxy-6-polyprenyl-1,4-benzoquinol methylase
MFDKIAPRYDLVNKVMTFRLDVAWRREAIKALSLPRGSLVGDVACGTGDLCRELEKAGLLPIGFDYSEGMLARARTKAPLAQADALALPVADAALDGITSGFALRNVVDLDALLNEVARCLRPGGRVSLLEVSRPDNLLLRRGHAFYFQRVVPLIGGLLSDRDSYKYLPASTAYLPDTDALERMLSRAGFINVWSKQLSAGVAQLLTATRRFDD